MGSMGVGGGVNASSDMQALLRHQQHLMQGGVSAGTGVGNKSSTMSNIVDDGDDVDIRRQELNEQIARLQKEAQQLPKGLNNGASNGNKRDSGGDGAQKAKRIKSENGNK